jgi:hypothetical protein
LKKGENRSFGVSVGQVTAACHFFVRNQFHLEDRRIGGQSCDFFPHKIGGFFSKHCKINHHIDFYVENRQFFAENWPKSPKILFITTSDPDEKVLFERKK